MKALQQQIRGLLMAQEEMAAVLLDDHATGLYLRFPLVSLGAEDAIFPAFLLDDWGNEINTLELYQWVRDNGPQFPRAEVFGYELDGSETQAFLRALDLVTRYPCYAYPAADAPISAGTLVRLMFVLDSSVDQAVRIKRPAGIEPPLRDAQLHWWRVNPVFLPRLDLSRLG